MNDDLVSRLRQDAEMLQDGPQSNLTKLWHSEVVKDAAKDCQEAAQALTEARAEIERLKSGINGIVNCQGPMTRAQVREACAEILDNKTVGLDNQSPFAGALNNLRVRAEAAESELSTLRDILVLCGELGGMGKDETPAGYLRRLIDEVAGVESLRARVREVVGLGLDVISEERGWGTYPRMEGSEIYTDADVFSRAARQLNEDLK